MALLLILTALSGSWIFYIQMKYDKLKRAFLRYENLVSQEDFISQLNFEVHRQENNLASLSEEYGNLRLRYDKTLSQEEVEAELDLTIESKKKQLQEVERQRSKTEIKVRNLQEELTILEDSLDLQSVGFYQTKFDFFSSDDCSILYKEIKEKQKDMIRGKEAAIANNSLTMNGNAKEGKKLSTNFIRLALNIFNSECDSIIRKVNPSNINSSEKKMRKTFDDLNKKCEVIYCEITSKYLNLRVKELQLKYELDCKKQEEKDQEKEINARMKEEEKDRRKIEEERRKIREAAEREDAYQNQLESALLKIEFAVEQERQDLESQIDQLRKSLADATSDKEDAISRSAMVKAGYIYVISNIGSIQKDVYRICMTKRSSNEDEYIRLMTPVVPYPFDIHFKFISEDASDTLRRLHERFDSRRVNKMNSRREFFSVSIEEIAQAIEEIKKETGGLKNIQYEKAPQALEYRRTLAALRKDEQNLANERIKLNDEVA